MERDLGLRLPQHPGTILPCLFCPSRPGADPRVPLDERLRILTSRSPVRWPACSHLLYSTKTQYFICVMHIHEYVHGLHISCLPLFAHVGVNIFPLLRSGLQGVLLVMKKWELCHRREMGCIKHTHTFWKSFCLSDGFPPEKHLKS